MRCCQTLLLCCLTSAALADETPIGRLFFAPAERAALETARQIGTPIAHVPAQPGTAAAAIAMNGFVRRSDGKGTVWVNGQPIQESTGTKDIEVGKLRADSDRVRIKLFGSRQTILLRAGQRYDTASGKVSDPISGASIPDAALPDR